MHAVLSIGSNMDDRYALLDTVIEEFKDEIVAQSAIYSTPPWGIEDQDEFLNAVLVVEVEDTPIELLRRGQKLEEAAERVRVRKWGPRTLDVDIVQIIKDGDSLGGSRADLATPLGLAACLRVDPLVGSRT